MIIYKGAAMAHGTEAIKTLSKGHLSIILPDVFQEVVQPHLNISLLWMIIYKGAAMAHGAEAMELIIGNVFKKVILSSPRDFKLYLVWMTGPLRRERL